MSLLRWYSGAPPISLQWDYLFTYRDKVSAGARSRTKFESGLSEWSVILSWVSAVEVKRGSTVLIFFVWHVATIVLCLKFLTKQQLTSQRPGNLLRLSQVGSWSWNETHLKIHMTVIIDINLHPMEASSKVDLLAAGYVRLHRRCNAANCSVLLIMFIT